MASPIRKRPYPPEDGGAPFAKKSKGGPDQDKIQKMIAEARSKAAIVAARLAEQKSGSALVRPQAPPAANGSKVQSAAERLAAFKSRVSSAVNRSSASVPTRPTSSASHASQFRRDETEPEDASRARGGLDVGLHPALLGESGESQSNRRGKSAMQPKFATTMANRRPESAQHGRGGKSGKKQLDLSLPSLDLTDPNKNPYYDPNIASKAIQPRRVAKALKFNPKGKYIEQANALRRFEALEEMKIRIAASARKVGIDEDMHVDKAFAPEEPPTIEWWDQHLLPNANYDHLEVNNLIESPDSLITAYIQHPIQLEPPQDKHIPPSKPMPLTKKEQQKVRRQRRAMELKEKQAKVRLGLEPPPPPKVKKSNMMRVLGEEAVKDPTAVEARVNREIRERLEKHLATNEARKLSKEQRLDKTVSNQEKDLAMGVRCLVFRIENLSNGRHRFKINKTAEQLSLTGICIFNPRFNLVIVEGGQHSITKYRKLMINRINWTENVEPLPGTVDIPDDHAGGDAETDMANNKCTLVWEGELKQRGFKKFSAERCPTEGMAKSWLERGKMEYMWTLAKNIGTI
ncbi:pre-mRNA processing factor 3-domain-containing protein [Geopyxis carbonaria]|nr:pre-mRNA processing factor 3-domain-containing protein [Geopyxis carbonaria]